MRRSRRAMGRGPPSTRHVGLTPGFRGSTALHTTRIGAFKGQLIGTSLTGGWQGVGRHPLVPQALQPFVRAVGAGIDPGVPVRIRYACPDAARRACASSSPAARGSAPGCTWPRYSAGLCAWLSRRRRQRRGRDRGAVPLDAARQARDDAGAPVVRRARRAAASAADAGERLTRRVAGESAQAERGNRRGCSGRRRLDRHRCRARRGTGREANLALFHRDAERRPDALQRSDVRPRRANAAAHPHRQENRRRTRRRMACRAARDSAVLLRHCRPRQAPAAAGCGTVAKALQGLDVVRRAPAADAGQVAARGGCHAVAAEHPAAAADAPPGRVQRCGAPHHRGARLAGDSLQSSVRSQGHTAVPGCSWMPRRNRSCVSRAGS